LILIFCNLFSDNQKSSISKDNFAKNMKPTTDSSSEAPEDSYEMDVSPTVKEGNAQLGDNLETGGRTKRARKLKSQ